MIDSCVDMRIWPEGLTFEVIRLVSLLLRSCSSGQPAPQTGQPEEQVDPSYHFITSSLFKDSKTALFVYDRLKAYF